ncbi:hypothetical protein MHYP_G00112450 [Metynnis hypsauchen]
MAVLINDKATTCKLSTATANIGMIQFPSKQDELKQVAGRLMVALEHLATVAHWRNSTIF